MSEVELHDQPKELDVENRSFQNPVNAYERHLIMKCRFDREAFRGAVAPIVDNLREGGG